MDVINLPTPYIDMLSLIVHRLFTSAILRYGLEEATVKMRELLDDCERFMMEMPGHPETNKPDNITHREYAEHIFAAIAARCEPPCRNIFANVFGPDVAKRIPDYVAFWKVTDPSISLSGPSH